MVFDDSNNEGVKAILAQHPEFVASAHFPLVRSLSTSHAMPSQDILCIGTNAAATQAMSTAEGFATLIRRCKLPFDAINAPLNSRTGDASIGVQLNFSRM